MGMNLFKRSFRDASQESTFDLNLAPMMDMMVSIIPFMLLSATFLQLNLINVPLPTPVAKALEQDRKNEKRDVSVKASLGQSKSIIIEVKSEGGKVSRHVVESDSGDYDFKKFHKKLVEAKQQYPKLFRLELNPENGVNYKSIVLAMDASRNMDLSDPKIKIENVDTPLLFPDVILANVMED